MPMADLSLVSSTLRGLIDTNVNFHAGGGSPVTVVLGYPEDQAGATRTLNLHLYHVAEDQFNRNNPGPGSDANSVATTPLTLSLYYLLTSHHTGPSQAVTEQEIMGYALKTLHDFALIDNSSQVVSSTGVVTDVLAPGLRSGYTRMEVILRPLTPEDALSYWASEQQQAVRLGAYYEVRLAQLEPEKPKSASGRVLSVGKWVGPMVDVAIERSQSRIEFARPAAIAGSLPEFIDVSPARPFLDFPPADPAFDQSHHFTLFGRGLASGIRRRLVISRDGWIAQGVPGGEIALDEGIQPAAPSPIWGVSFSDDRVEVQLSPQIQYLDTGGATQTLDLVPGTYQARVDIVVGDRIEGSGSREIVRRSNTERFTISPRLVSHDAPVTIPGIPAEPSPGDQPRDRITLNFSPTFDLSAPESTIELIVDGTVYSQVSAFDPVPANSDGEFVAAANTLTLQPLFDTGVAGHRSVRLVVNGAEAQPFWIEV